jgi:L-ribulose-5-phosphate 4-epimerase
VPTSEPLATALSLSRALGDPIQHLAILAEGNVSVRIDDQTFWVKASGHEMATITESGFTAVRRDRILASIDADLNDTEVRQILASSRKDATAGHPSVETFMHALLLGLPDVECIGHTHPTAMLPMLCSLDAEQEAGRRYFPDEIVCCGPASAWVPYVDPGLPLARAIRDSTEKYAKKWGTAPKTIWLQNHGLIALGRNPKEVLSATQMSVKAAVIRAAPHRFPLTSKQIDRIHTRPDEHHRQALLWR